MQAHNDNVWPMISFSITIAVHTIRLNALFSSRNASDVTMRYLLRIYAGYKHLAKKIERTVLPHVGRGGSEMAAFV